MRWIELFLTVVREGLGIPSASSSCFSHWQERTDILAEMMLWRCITTNSKSRMRQDPTALWQGQGPDDADAEDEANRLCTGRRRGNKFWRTCHRRCAGLRRKRRTTAMIRRLSTKLALTVTNPKKVAKSMQLRATHSNLSSLPSSLGHRPSRKLHGTTSASPPPYCE